MSAWDLNLEGATQKDLVITDEPEITVDNLEVAQFIYLLLNNERIRHVIDTITSKVVLILGRFTPRAEGRARCAPRGTAAARLHTGALRLRPADEQGPDRDRLDLASMARFVMADLTEASSVPHELGTQP